MSTLFWLVAVIVAVAPPLSDTLASPPPLPMEPGSATLSVPLARVPVAFFVPVMPLVSAAPSQRGTAELRFNAPTRLWVIVSR